MSEIKTIQKLPVFEGAEISWFAPLCDGDDDFLGIEIQPLKAIGRTPLIL